jgi:hypothetical protein
MQSEGFCNTLITLSGVISNFLSSNKSLLSILKGGFLLFGEGSDRIWEFVAVDEFRLEEQTQPEQEADLT